MESLLTAYGPLGFGLFTVLVLWRVVVTPSLCVLDTIVKSLENLQRQQDALQESQQVVLSRLEEMDGKPCNYELRREQA